MVVRVWFYPARKDLMLTHATVTPDKGVLQLLSIVDDAKTLSFKKVLPYRTIFHCTIHRDPIHDSGKQGGFRHCRLCHHLLDQHLRRCVLSAPQCVSVRPCDNPRVNRMRWWGFCFDLGTLTSHQRLGDINVAYSNPHKYFCSPRTQ